MELLLLSSVLLLRERTIVECSITDYEEVSRFLSLLPGGFTATAVQRPTKHRELRATGHQTGAKRPADPGDLG